MAEAVFTISANIEPTIDPRTLERQGQEIAKQLSGQFKKELQPVDLQVKAGAAFTKVIDTARNALTNFGQTARNALNSVRNGVDTLVTKGRSGFLKLSDTFKLTQRSIVGFGDGIIKTIQDTNLFENALERLRSTGDTFNELPTSLQQTRAAIEAGVSPLQDAAKNGNQLAQALTPLTEISNGTAKSLDEVVERLGAVSSALISMAQGVGRGGDSLSILEADTEKFARQMLKLVPGTGAFADKLRELSDEARRNGGSTQDFIDKLVEFKKTAIEGGTSLESFGGAAGRFGAIMNRLGLGFDDVDPKIQKLARQQLVELNKQLLKVGAGDQLTGFERLQARISIIGDRIQDTSAGFQAFAGTLAKITPGNFFDDVTTHLKVLEAEGKSTAFALGKALSTAFNDTATVQFIKAASNGFKEFREKGENAINALGNALKKGFLSTDIGQSIARIADTISTKFSEASAKVSTVIDGLRAKLVRFSGTPLGENINRSIIRIGEGFNGLNRAFSAVGKGIRDTAVTISANLALPVVAKLQEVGERLAPAFDRAKTAASGLVTSFKEFAGIEKEGSFLPDFSPVTAAAKDAGDRAGSFLSTAFAGALNVSILGQRIGDALDRSREAITRFGANIQTGLSKALDFVGGEKLVGSITRLFDNLQTTIQTRFNTLRGTGEKGGSMIGSNIVAGIASGLEQAKNLVTRAIEGTVNFLVRTANRILGIQSPSKVFFAIGKFIVEGLANGIKASAGLVTKSIGVITNGLIDTVKGAANLAKQGFDSLINVGKAAGLALAGLGATAVVTGSQFNILQQVVNATLPSILGSAEASKALLVQVNALNDSSPFARSAFLELTRVLAGFGVQAEQITPTIDAIQQAVAATGGGEQDLLELGNAFAKIASTGRLTGDILQSFTVRGIDAIQLLAAETGKTAATIREEMSSGLLSATQTITQLSNAISTRFAGATDAVAKNFPGALDRVNARLRDVGASLTKAFINPEGGGALVDLFNAVATALSAVNKILIPIFLPAIQVVANVMTNVSKSIEDFLKPLLSLNKGLDNTAGHFGTLGVAAGGVTEKIRPFVESLGPLIPILAGIVGFFPAFLSFIPVVGPLLGSIGGPGGAVLAIFIALVARSKELQDALKGLVSGFQEAFAAFSPPDSDPLGGILDSIKAVESTLAGGLASFIEPLGAAFGQLAAQVGPVVVDVLPKFANLLATIAGTLGPIVANIISALSPTIAFLIGAFGEVADAVAGALGGLKKGLEPVIPAIGDLLAALQPAADLIKGVIIVAFQVLGQILPPIGELLAWVIGLVTDAINAINPLIQALADAFTGFKANLQDIGQSLEGFVNTAIDGINKVIRGLNLIKPGKDIKQIEDIKFPDFATGASNAKKQVEAVGFAIKTQVPTVKQLENAYKNAFDTASREAADAQKKVGALTDSLNLQLQETGKKINPVFDAQSAVQASNQALANARENAQKAAGQIGQLEKERAKALRDALTPVQEMAAAERELTRTRRGLDKINRDILETEQQLRDLRNEELLGEKRAALDRAIERAKIALNKATRDQINLDKEANKVAIPSVNLAGLNLDQIRAKLANVRASLSAQKAAQALTEKDAKTQQEIDDERKSAALDVADAEQSLKDASRARQQFELDNTNAIRDTELQLEELRFNKEEQLIKEQEDLQKINDLRAGETMQQKIIKDFEEKIKKARDDSAQAQRAVTEAVKKTREAEAQLALVTAQLKNDTEGMANAQLRIWQLKGQGLALDKQTAIAIQGQLDNVRAIMRELAGAKTEADAAEQRKAEADRQLKQFNIDQAIRGINEELGRAQQFTDQFGVDRNAFRENQDALFSGFTKLAAFLRTASDAGAIQTKSGDVAAAQKIIAQPAFLESLAKAVLETPGGDLRQILKELLARAGLVIPGFATGYAPGEAVHRGMNDGKGLVRMFEFGKEAVLPLTRATDMKRVVQNPQVLPSILQALPKLSLAAANGDPQAIETLASMARPTSGGTVSGSAFQSRQAKKQDNEQMAASIASAVKVAVKEALAESDGLGNDIDINVTPATDHNVAIANEVRRQVKKYFEGRR